YADTVKSGVNVNIYDVSNDGTQVWGFQEVSGGYVIRNMSNTDCVLTVNGSNVEVQSWVEGNAKQIWTLTAKSAMAEPTDPEPTPVDPEPTPVDPEPTPTPVDPERKDVHFEKQTIYFQGQFTDVAADQWFTKSVAAAFEYSLMKGNSETTFNPYGDVTIAEAVTMAARIHSIYTTGSENFVQGADKWYQVYLDYAYENGIISKAYYNCDVTHKATRAQFAEIFANSLPDEALYPMNNVADNAVPDVSSSDSYAAVVYKLYRAGILTGGDANGTFSPNTYITRAECAAIVSRMAESNNRVAFTLD
ncbi:MAG: S-layer homology domain-containing protein, partial [Oscillospiraceae bacterium]|nr:S-layer homology domain-containing protein [Oscillospiraceae bacterium]